MPAERARLAPIDVLLHLKASSLLTGLSPDVLAVLAHHMSPRTFAAGEAVLEEKAPLRSMHFVVEGRVRVAGAGYPSRDAGPGDAIGALPLLAQAKARLVARAEIASTTLELGADTLADLLEDQAALLEHFLRLLCRRMIAERKKIPQNAGYATPVDDLVCPARPFDQVERLLVMRHALPFARTSVDALAELARHMDEVRLGPGHELWKRGAPAETLIVPVCGTIRCTGDGVSFRVGKGSVVGILDALAGEPHWADAVTDGDLVALRIPTADFLEVLDNELSLAMALLEALAAEGLQLLAGGGDDAAWSTRPEGFDQPPA